MYYSVSIMYKSKRNDTETPLWEEQIILVSALDETEAEEKAIKFARKYETEFDAANSGKVTWKFYQVESVFIINDKLEDGVELFSRFLRNSEAESILTPFSD